ncbi:Protein MAIN-LIKE 1 [Glycine max]|nr:Protein MAIN-LIKE 1 [Glycine max]
MQIIVRTKGLGWTLGRVIGRALGREVNRDLDEALQRRRPTTSAYRQREAAPVAEDVHHVYHAADEPEEAAVDDVVPYVDGFLGGTHDTSVLIGYVHHVAERPELKLSSHGRKVEKFGRPTPEIEGLVAVTGLSPMIACSLGTGDWGLISAFVERWHKETSSFHLPVGEVTITFDDVASLLHLPIIGAFHSFKVLHMDEVVLLLVELLEVSANEANVETIQCHGAYVWLLWFKCDTTKWIIAAGAYMLHLVGCTLFANKSVVFLDAFRDLTQSGSYAWGSAALVHMYENLNDASKSSAKQLAGYITLLQSGKALPVLTYQERLNRLTSDVEYWIPYDDHRAYREFKLISLFSRRIRWGPSVVIHRPERIVRQFGYVQTIPPLLASSTFCIEDIVFLIPCTSGSDMCCGWTVCSKLHGVAGDPPRHPPVVHNDTFIEIYIPQHLMTAKAMEEAPADALGHVEKPRHAVEACQTIAERLEWLLNLRIVTNGTKAYIVMEDCLRISQCVMRNTMYTCSHNEGSIWKTHEDL